MNVTLKSERKKPSQDDVNSGRSTVGEEYSRDEIEEKIARGLAQAERGETIDGEAAFRQLRAYSVERRRR